MVGLPHGEAASAEGGGHAASLVKHNTVQRTGPRTHFHLHFKTTGHIILGDENMEFPGAFENLE